MARAITLPIEASVKAGEQLLSAGVTAGSKLRIAKAWTRSDVDADAVEGHSRATRELGGEAALRGGRSGARAMADGGPAFGRLHNLDMDFDTSELASAVGRYQHVLDDMGISVERLADDLEEMAKRPDGGDRQVPGVERLAREMANAGNAANFRGQVHNVRVIRDEVGIENTRRIEFNNKHGRGEIDIETTDGRIIESKGGNWGSVTPGDGSTKFKRLKDQIPNYQQYARQEGRTIEVAFETPVSDDLERWLLDKEFVDAVRTV